MARFRPDVTVVWPGFDDLWAARPWPLVDDVETFAEPLAELVDVSVAAAARSGSTLVFVLPAIPENRPLGVGDPGNRNGVFAAATHAREVARCVMSETVGVLVADAEEVVRHLGVPAAIDDRRWAGARVPYTEAAFDLMAHRVANLLRIALKGARKVAVVDADNTLWGGVVGEDGAVGIDLLDNGPGDSYRSFQAYLKELQRAGTLIALASKNNAADVWDAFARPEMVLRREDLAASRVDWAAKVPNIEAIANELNLGVASMVFIDDSAVERGQVDAALPEMVTIAFPQDPARWREEVARRGELDRLPPTQSDLARAGSYSIETDRRLVRATMTPEEYLASLELRVAIRPAEAADLARLSQLVVKTNQFTLDGERHTEVALATMIAAPERCAVRLVSARDRFGDYGVIGAFIVKHCDGVATLDTFVLSCRAMGRGVETAMLAGAGTDAVDGQLVLTVREGSRNAPAREYFVALGAVVGERFVLTIPEWPSHVTNDESGCGPVTVGAARTRA